MAELSFSKLNSSSHLEPGQNVKCLALKPEFGLKS
jgi:hypothetical protein